MWKSDKSNINIGPDWKKMWCFNFFRKFVPVPHDGSHIIIKNHLEFRLFFPMADETRELPHHNKQAWLHHGRLNFTQQLSRVGRGRATMMLRTKIMKRTKPIGIVYFQAAGLQTDFGYKMTTKKEWLAKFVLNITGIT